jgi:hypothetical protein
MLWAFAGTGPVGLMLGLWFRAPALIAASGVTAIVCLSAAPFTELEPASAVGITFALVDVLQVGYLAGLMLSGAWSRGRLSCSGHASLAIDEPGAHSPGRGHISLQRIHRQRPATALANANDQ